MRTLLFLLLSLLTIVSADAAPLQTRNVVLITFDGLRWQELFSGAEEALISKEHGGVNDTNALRKAFWRDTPEARREALLPFLWGTVAKQGQLFGNTNKGSVVRVTNLLNFSYPGYNEILCGFPDPRIFSNAKKPNHNVTVLEWLHQKPAFQGRVAAYCAWDVFPYILNRERSGLHIRAGWEGIYANQLTERQQLFNQLIADTTPAHDGVLFDSFLYAAIDDYLRTARPRVLYVSFGETDDWAHDGKYDRVLHSAHAIDGYIRRLWDTLQSLPEYRGQTTLLITTDHGRGSGLKEWRDHGQRVAGAQYIWLGALGPDTPALGERHNTAELTQSQVAATLAQFLGEDYCAAVLRAAKPVADLFPK
ncbi:MAG: alkaline phosphatase family protein [Verrucomicrobiota bacterium]